jgi:dipeptidyl aminopeptidase/acylaminoacyl peptidase
MLASGSWDNTIRLWETSTGNILFNINGHEKEVNSIAFSPDGKTLASGSDDNTIRLWDTATGIESLRIGGLNDECRSIAYSPDGKTLASGGVDTVISLWEIATGRKLLNCKVNRHSVWSVAFSPDGKTLVSGGEDNTIRLWDVATGKEILRVEGGGGPVDAVAFSPDGKMLASSLGNTTILIWDIASTALALSSKPVARESQESFWDNLCCDEAAFVYMSIWTLSGNDKDVVQYLGDRLNSASTKKDLSGRIVQAISELDHDDIIVRDIATQKLLSIGDAAIQALEKAIVDTKSNELKSRSAQIVENLKHPFPITPGEPLRRWRAMQALEWIGSREAREVMTMLEKESPSLRERSEARASLERLNRRATNK